MTLAPADDESLAAFAERAAAAIEQIADMDGAPVVGVEEGARALLLGLAAEEPTAGEDEGPEAADLLREQESERADLMAAAADPAFLRAFVTHARECAGNLLAERRAAEDAARKAQLALAVQAAAGIPILWAADLPIVACACANPATVVARPNATALDLSRALATFLVSDARFAGLTLDTLAAVLVETARERLAAEAEAAA